MRPVDALIPYARNAKQHSDAQVAQIAASIREFGWGAPILVDGRDNVIAGHGRLLAARKLGMAEVPVVPMGHLTDTQRKALILADNRIAENAPWDDELLRLELTDLLEADFDLDLLGWSKDERDYLLAGDEPENQGNTDDDEIPETPANPVSRPGDVWVLGRHRLMCGDCRDYSTVERLLHGSTINLAFTSPPYAQQREYDQASGFKPIHPDAYVEWFRDVAANVQALLANDGSWFVNIKPAADGLDTSLYVFDLVIAHVRDWGWHFATEFCWERAGIPKSVTRRFKNQFEPIYQFAKGNWKMSPDAVRRKSDHVPKPRGKGAGNTSWGAHQGGGIESINMSGKQCTPGFEWFGEHVDAGFAYPGNRLPTFSGSHEATGHSAAFPVGLPEFFINAYTDAGDSVFDPFMGSGSSLIAAEKTGRVGYGTEISPMYCDVIIRRWQSFTGQSAIRERDGAAFNDLQPA